MYAAALINLAYDYRSSSVYNYKSQRMITKSQLQLATKLNAWDSPCICNIQWSAAAKHNYNNWIL